MNSSREKSDPFDFDVSAYPRLPRLRGLMVVGTDTSVGKTLVAGAIARSLRRAGRRVEVFKPAATGCRGSGEGLISEDAEFLAHCADSRRGMAEITPLRYAAAAAPNVAAGQEGKAVDVEAVLRAYAKLADAADVVVVEGIGGLLCPISDEFWVVHFARLARLPVLIVARAGLGTINHTLLSLHAARSAGLDVAGVIINRRPAGEADLAVRTNGEQIARRGGVKILAVVPDDPANSVAEKKIATATQSAIDATDWMKIAATG